MEVVRHIFRCARRANIYLITVAEHSVLDLWTQKAACLAVHCLRSEGRGDKIYSFALKSVLYHLDFFLGRLSEFNYFKFDSGVVLWPKALPALSIVIHAWLTVLDAVDRIPFPELDFSHLMQTI